MPTKSEYCEPCDFLGSYATHRYCRHTDKTVHPGKHLKDSLRPDWCPLRKHEQATQSVAPKMLYRFESTLYETGPEVTLHGYSVVSITLKGFWIDVYGAKKWVSGSAKKRFAYPTKDEAMVSFKARKRRQISVLTEQIKNAELVLEKLNRVKPEYFDYTEPLIAEVEPYIPA